MRVVLILFAWLLQSPFQGWETLSRLELVSGFDDFLGEETEVPVFSEELKGFEGEIVTIEGYVIPLQTSREGDFFVLSRFPYNNCFFCGNAGQRRRKRNLYKRQSGNGGFQSAGHRPPGAQCQ